MPGYKVYIKLAIGLLMMLMLAVNCFATQCNPRNVNSQSVICVCDLKSCDGFSFDWNKPETIVQIQSSMNGKRFEISIPSNNFELANSSIVNSTLIDKLLNRDPKQRQVLINLDKKYQSIIGFGGAFTDATVENINSLSKEGADFLLESYFGSSGIEYSIGRVTIAGSDFSSRAYTYDDSIESDFELKNWALAPEDLNLKIPYIKRANEIANKASRKIKLFASPWSPPAWMKSNNNLVRGHLKKDDKVYQSYAEYLVKFFDSYKQLGLPFWGATVQNEPLSAYMPSYFFNSLQFSKTEQEKFITEFYGPLLSKHGYNKTNFNLMIGDDNLGLVDVQAPSLLDSNKVQEFVNGVGYHWYTSNSITRPKINTMYEKVKDKVDFMLMTEACTGSNPINRGVRLGNWNRAEDYAIDIIEDLRRYTSGWVDWNMALNEQGGPNWSKNYVDAPIIVNSNAQEFYKQPMFYILGHFSKFYKEGDIIVDSQVTNEKSLLSVAAYRKNTQNLIVTILNKKSSPVVTTIEFQKSSGEQSKFYVDLDQRSINTFVIKLA